MRLLLLFLLFFVSGLARSQNKEDEIIQLSGYITDSISSEPISFITIRIQGSKKGVITNSQGFFSLPVRVNDTLLFTAIGYEPYHLLIKANYKNGGIIRIRMIPAVYTIRGLKVRSYNRERFKYELLTVELPLLPPVNPNAFIRPGELKLPPPPPGIRFSPSDILGDLPFVERALKKKRSKKFIDQVDPKEIPLMK